MEKNMSQTPLTLADESIGQIAKLLQLAMLSGTDLIDHMRMLQFEDDGTSKLVMTTVYKAIFESQLETMEDQIETLMKNSLSDTPES